MRRANKIVSLVLALGILLSIAIPTVSAADTLSFSDVPSDYTYYSAITNLTAEGIINGFEDGTFKPEDPVTRAQFTKIICYALNVGSIKYSEADRAKFPDVDPNHWAIDNITTAKNSGIINGYDDGTFKPENSVLYEQAVKMAVCALGYPEDRAERAGGTAGAYPNGYLNLASKAKLLDKITGAKIGEPLTRGRVAQLIDNMLGAEQFDAENGTTGNTLRDQTSSTRSSAEGRIVAVYGTSIYYDEESECNKKQIELELNNGKREFYGIENLNINDLNDYLGRSVIVYYEIESGADYYEAYNIAFQNKKNYEVTINVDDIEDFTNSKLEYWTEDGEDTETISVASDIAIIHNGQAVKDRLSDIIDDFSDKSGYLTLICSLDNDTADVAFVRTYETVFVNSIDSKNYKIYDYYDSSRSFTLDETDRSKTITFTKDGKASTFSGITTSSVVSISSSDDGKLIDVQISTKRQSGTITDVLSDDKIKIDKTPNTYYKFTDSCDRRDQLSAGVYVQLYLDAFGRVAKYSVSTEKTYSFGYLAAAEDGTLTNPKIEVMIYKMSTSNSTLTGTKYSLKDNVKIDGKVYSVSKNSDAIMDLLRRTAAKSGMNDAIDGKEPENAEFAQPVRFTTSSSNVIDSLLTSESTGEFNVSLKLVNFTETPLLCKANGTTLDKYTITSATQIILVPSDRANGTYMTKSYSYFKKDESYYVQLANVPSTNKPAAIYVYGTATSGSDVTTEVLSETNIPMIVTRATDVNYMDQIRRCLKLLSVTGEEFEVYDDGRKDTEVIRTVSAGDVIRVAADGDKLVDAIEVLAVAADVVAGEQDGFVRFDGTSDGKDDLDAPLRVVLGLAHNAKENTLVMAPSFDYPTSKDVYTYTYTENVKIYVIDTSNSNNPDRMVDEGVFGDIIGRAQQQESPSKVMVYTEKGSVKAMVVFK